MADHSFSDGVPSDSVEAAKNASNTEKLTDQVMQNPRVLAALQERLDNVPHTPSSYIETLPKAVKRRINALKQLQDIKVKFSDPGQPMSFVLEFHFEPNDYFTNSVLTKTYKMKSEPDKADPFSFEGPEIVDCDGCTIDWKKGKNVTVKTIKKKQ
ncbi:NAP1L4 isoform 4, partial [Pan troglodytes]